MDAPEQLLFAEGVCRQLKIITYLPEVIRQKRQREDEEERRSKKRAQTVNVRTGMSTKTTPEGGSSVMATATDKPSRGTDCKLSSPQNKSGARREKLSTSSRSETSSEMDGQSGSETKPSTRKESEQSTDPQSRR